MMKRYPTAVALAGMLVLALLAPNPAAAHAALLDTAVAVLLVVAGVAFLAPCWGVGEPDPG